MLSDLSNITLLRSMQNEVQLEQEAQDRELEKLHQDYSTTLEQVMIPLTTMVYHLCRRCQAGFSSIQRSQNDARQDERGSTSPITLNRSSFPVLWQVQPSFS